MKRFYMLAFAALVSLSTPALAQKPATAPATFESPAVFHAEDEERLEAFLLTEEVDEARMGYVQMLQTERDPDCNGVPTFERDAAQSRHWFDEENPRLEFPAGAERPENAVWYEAYEVSICNIREPARARFVVRAGGPVEAQWVPPGRTRLTDANVRSQWPLFARASLQNVRGVRGCSPSGMTPEGTIIDTRVTGGPGWFGMAARENEWDEQWTMRLCGRNAPFDIRVERNPDTGELRYFHRVLSRRYGSGPAYPVGVPSQNPEAAERIRRNQEERDNNPLN